MIFPFEEKFYRERGVDATFVGHPLADFRNRRSRAKIMPLSFISIRKALDHAYAGQPGEGSAYEFADDSGSGWATGFGLRIFAACRTDARRGVPAKFMDQQRITLVPESLPALWHSRAGIIASGTATVEAAMMRTPFVMVYRVSPLTYFLGKPRVKVPHFAMVNLIAGEEVVPELVQHDFTATNVVGRLQEILPDGAGVACWKVWRK